MDTMDTAWMIGMVTVQFGEHGGPLKQLKSSMKSLCQWFHDVESVQTLSPTLWVQEKPCSCWYVGLMRPEDPKTKLYREVGYFQGEEQKV